VRTNITYEVGDKIVIKKFYFDNDMGGTEIDGGFRATVEVTKTFHDYETGQVFHGRLVKDEDVAKVKKLGTTGHAGKHPSPHRDNWTWNPAKVYFYDTDIEGPAEGK
jgi:hypothetical protein